MTKLIRNVLIILLCLMLLLTGVFLIGRYGWKLGGFAACEGAGIEQVIAENGRVRIRGFYTGSFPQGFIGYYAEQHDGTLYVGFKFSGLFGMFETGDFDITIPTEGTVSKVIIKSGDNEYAAWPKEDEPVAGKAETAENGIYVSLERSDVYSVSWYYENKSGGVTNADGTALEIGKSIYLDEDVFYNASNLDHPIPVMLIFSDKDGETLAHINLSYDPKSPILLVTLRADAKVYINGVEAEEFAIPTAYEEILAQYRIALKEGWNGQRLTDADLNIMLCDAAVETVGYSVEDIDTDGTAELIIGTLNGDDFYRTLIFTLYTLNDDGNAVRVFDSIERDRYYYAGGVRFANIGSSSADSDFETTLKLEGEELVDMTYITEPEDYVQLQLIPII